ncbi:MFS transporter [Rhodococcus sp. 06-412-2C]|uniref:MFS transporter n=1 Tax=unclassified Rhodococcus (in: high G+C Gram-positive bacteria) TaxID=192944 RepID=UPI000B9A2C4D|nr:MULTISPECIES: MFS transporter [unclassified Rhodococcus (in: high G+C Gram-positive bacteria)]OZC84644.1 MFS transporter [Rhodococcus sp. 06-412-2C]OZC98297.1 MFS transporter [Rhodococcus sp. 06-412-2B]
MSHDTLPLTPRAQTSRATSARRHGVGFWVVAAAFLTAMAFSTVPSPLYPLYQVRDGFSTFMVTIVFAAYAVGVIVSLILAGHVSDWVGRKKVLIAALLLELVAAVMFLSGTALPLLLVARLVTGLGVGALTATATAYLHELHSTHRPTASGQRFEKVSTAANIGGLGVGPLVAGFLAQFVAAPLHTPYAVFAVLLVIAVVGVALVPETVPEPTAHPAYHPQRISADHGDRAGYFAAAAAGFASFAVFGVFTSVAPGFVAGTLDHPSRLLSGATVFAVFGTAAAAQTLTSRMSSSTKLALGITAEALGLIALVTGMYTLSLPAFLIGGVIAGIGAGVLFKAAVGTVAAMAAPAERSEALAGLFLISYLGLGIPAVGIGIATLSMSATTAMTGLAAIVLMLLTGVAILARRASAGA